MIDVMRAVVAAAYRSLGESGLALGSAGNISIAERSSGVALVTGSGLVATEATPEGISTVDLATGEHREGPMPSSELPSHLALLRAGHRAVVHCHAPHATALGLVRDAVPLVLAEQAIRVGGPVPVIGYVRPGTPEMAAALVAALAGGVRAAVIRNHGLFAVGPDLTAALNATFAAEEAARVTLLASAVGEPATVPAAEVAPLRALGGLDD